MYYKSKTYILSLILCMSVSILNAQQTDPPFMRYLDHPWVDSVFNSLSPIERIGQLIWIDAYSNRDIGEDVALSNLLRKTGAGGIIFFEGNALKQTDMLNHFQDISKVPLLIAEDGEWGLGMRLEGVTDFPYQMTLGAIRDDSLIYQMGKAVAAQFKRAGVHINLAPVADVNNNQGNPVINYRSFGENPDNVARKTLMYMNGLQDNGVLATAKHFPGHGDTETDSHKGLPVIQQIVPGDSVLLALKAGIDILECPEDPLKTIEEIAESSKNDLVLKEEIDNKCRRILALKYHAGLSKYKPIIKENIQEELSPATSTALIRKLYANALTLLKNENNIVPVKNLDNTKIATVAVNKKRITFFQQRITDYQEADNFYIDPADNEAVNDLLSRLTDYDIVIAGIYGINYSAGSGFGVKPELQEFIQKLTNNQRTIITWFGNPYAIDKIEALKNSDGLLLAYQENKFTEDLSAQLLFGGIGARGALPVTINEFWPYDTGILTPGNIRMQYGPPESAGLSSVILEEKIDSIANSGLKAKAYPGCEVMVARKGTVVFHKTYGYHNYDNRIKVQKDDLYDLASVTKVSSTLAGLMLLDSEDKFSPDETLGNYLRYYRHSNKKDLLMSDILTHQAGLVSWIPFWMETVKKNGKFKRNTFDYHSSDKYPLEVAQSLFIHRNYRKKIFREIKRTPIGEKKYLYSDLAFIISPEIIEELTGEKWYDYVTTNVYKRLGANDICFNPWTQYRLSRIIPTEYDSLFRKQQLHGTVHDEGAAMLGGISGHAGLFATANDLMKLIEMYRRMGSYGGVQIIAKEVLEQYTRVQHPENDNRRGLGFDKPLLDNAELPREEAYPTKSASPSSFGHSGYTGTFIWMDPEYEISYVFLSNRVNPTRYNNLLSDFNIRGNILQAVYDSIVE
jgi:beta-N-acetylhexosaminidase